MGSSAMDKNSTKIRIERTRVLGSMVEEDIIEVIIPMYTTETLENTVAMLLNKLKGENNDRKD